MADNVEKSGLELVLENLDGFLSGLSKANKGIAGLSDAGDKAGGGLNAFSEVATGALRRVGEAAIDLGIQAGEALAGFVADSVTVAADYETTLNTFAAVTGGALDEAGISLDQFSDLFLDMGAKTQFSAGQAAEAAVELAKGGLDPATISAGGLEAALGLAAAGALELDVAAGIVAKTLGVWADTGVTAAQAADLLSQAANASTVDVDELALGMANVGGTAKTAGVSFQDTVTALALLAPGFSSASDAGTSLKTFLSRLVPSSDKATEAMRSLGLMQEIVFEDGSKKIQSAFFDTNGAFIGMSKAAELLQGSLAGLSEEQKLATLNTIFGQDAIRAAAFLAEAGAEGFDKMGDSMGTAGTAAEQAALRNKGFNFAMESLKGSIETVQIVLGQKLLPIITDVIANGFTPMVNSVLMIVNSFDSVIGAGGSVFDAIHSLGDIPWEDIFPASIAEVIYQIIDAVSQLPITLAPLIEASMNVADAFADSMPMIQSYVNDMVVFVEGLIAEFGPTIVANVSTFLNTLAEFWRAHGDEVMAVINFAFRFIATVIGGTLTLITGIVTIFTQQVTGLWSAASALLSGDWEEAASIIEETTGDMSATLTNTITSLLDGILSITGTDLESFTKTWSDVFSQVSIIVDQVGRNIVASISKTILDAIAAVRGLMSQWDSIGHAIVDGMVGGIVSAASNIAQAAIDAVNGAISAAKRSVGIHSPSKVAQEEVGQPIGEGILLGLQDQIDAIHSAAASLSRGLISAPATAAQQMSASYAYASTTNYNYAPTYGAAPNAPSSDFAIMRAMGGY